ncbi:MAG: RnfABCDGE type electron transport complex subunit B [Clostridia bacterium]|nr:RnfABCDGE type electron transport complex subunit B [Clostridia bacterium]
MNSLLLSSINVSSLLIVIAIVAVLAIVFALLISLVSKLCAVKEDERVSAVSEKLAGANCGGCGFAGCADYAKALVEGRATINDCGATANEQKEEIANILGLPFTATVETFAVVKCAGGSKCKDKFSYVGNKGCTFQTVFAGGSKACADGCLGDGTCADACQNGGIKIVDGVAYTDKALCTSCGACIKKCPKQLIELIPKTAKVYVACSTKCRGKDVMGVCEVGCIGCGLCAKNCPEKAITMVNNLPVIDYEKCSGCLTCVGKCPRKSIKEI